MCTNDREPIPMASLGFGDTERAWLDIIRLNCMSFERNDAEGWNRAISQAEVAYGHDGGPIIAARIAGLIRAMRNERRCGFGYLSPFCPNCRQRVTDDELQLVSLMKAGCRGEARAIKVAASSFAGQAEAPLLAAAARLFGAAFGPTQEECLASAPCHGTLH